jgi:four helix bundle protein
MTEPLFSFEKLLLYQHARAIRVRIYKLSRVVPKDEYKLKIQMRDAARSLTNNIAEGHGRYTFKDRKRFMTDARGSLQELVDDINLCDDESYAKPAHLADLKSDARKLLIELNAYMKYLRQQDARSVLNQLTT